MKQLTLDEIQKSSYEILCKFKEICDNNNFKYWLSYGTLLGAVRHQGFIPWDDDIDVQMPRKDYEKFIQYCIENEDKIKPLTLKHYKTCKKYIYNIARLSNSEYMVEYNIAKDYNLGTFIDIYPLDGYNIEDKKHIKKLNNKIWFVALCGQKKYNKSKTWWKNIFKYPYYIYSRFFNLNKLLIKLDKLAQKYDYEDSKYVGCMAWDLKEQYLKSYFNEFDELTFVHQKFQAPKNYDAVLKLSYGDTYMQLPKEEDRVGHHDYIVYKK